MSDAETEEDTTAALEEEEEEEEDEGLEGEGQDAEHEEEELEGQAGSRPLSSSSKLSATSLAPLTAPPQATPLPPPAITLDARGHAVLPPVGAGPAAAAALSPFSNGAGALLLRRGNTAFTARRLSEALALYRRGVKLCADSYEARLLLALLLNAGEACLQLAAQRAEDSLHAKPETGESPAAVAASSSSGQPAGPTAPGGPPRLLPLLGIRSAVRDGLAAEGAAFVQRALVKVREFGNGYERKIDRRFVTLSLSLCCSLFSSLVGLAPAFALS